MADLLNTNIGPERVEVIPQPIGIVPIPGAATAITAFILRTDKALAPVDVPVEILNLDQFVDQFGDETNMGLVYFAVQGFYDNAGTGNKAIIVNVTPSASGSTVSEQGIAEVGAAGLIEDTDVIVSTLAITTYVANTGVVSFSGSPDLTFVKEGDLFKDDSGRLFPISAINTSGFTITIPTNLNFDSVQKIHSAGGIDETTTAGKIIRLFTAGEFDSFSLVQAGSVKGTVTVTSVVADLVTASGGGFLNMGAQTGDIFVDSASNVFYIKNVIDDDKIQVDKSGVATGSADVEAGIVTLIQNTKNVETTNPSPEGGQNSTLFESSAPGYGILPTSVAPYPVNALKQHFVDMGGVSKQILSNTIIASGTVNGTFGTSANTLTYTSATGLVQFGGSENLSTVSPGDVWRDASNNDFIIDVVNDGSNFIHIAQGQTVNTAVGSTIRDGQIKVFFVDTAFDPGIIVVPEFFEPGNQLDFSANVVGQASDYFIADAVTQDSDYTGTQANGKGLHALDNTDIVDLICIPEVTSIPVQNALIDYCEERKDCFALLSIPENVRSPVVDVTKLSVTISTITNGVENSTVSLSGTPNLSSVDVGDLLSFGIAKYLILDIDETNFKITIQSNSASGSGNAAIIAPSAITYKEIIVNNPSKYAAWYLNHLKVQRPVDSSIATVDPVGYVAGVMARIDANIAIGGVSHAPAGTRFAGIAGIIGLDLIISEKMHGEGLRENFINRITEFPGAGRLIFGGYTADSGTSPAFTAEEQLIQVERTVLYIKKSLEPGLRSFIWENFSPATQLQAANAIFSFLRNNSYLFPAGLPEKQQFRVISVPPTDEALAKGLMKFRVQIRPNTALRFIEIALEFPIPQSQG